MMNLPNDYQQAHSVSFTPYICTLCRETVHAGRVHTCRTDVYQRIAAALERIADSMDTRVSV